MWAALPLRASGQAELDEIAQEKAPDPKSNLALRANAGGPAPVETERMSKDRWPRLRREKGGWPKEGAGWRGHRGSWGRRDS